MNQLDIPLLQEAGAWITLISDLSSGRAESDSTYWPRIVEGLAACQFTASPGWKIYRARLMPLERELDAEPLPPEEMGPPPPERAIAGRLNPKGTPYFYGALDIDTALAEVRPWRRARLTIGCFTSTASLRLGDLTGTQAQMHPDRSLQWLSFMLGRPVHRDDSDSYLPSQVFASKCREAGFDGVFYESALKPSGVNVAVFDATKLTCGPVELYEVTELSFSKQRLSWDDA